jgi:L-alanine-DL-glutamate epimerase-like enolase superfamily enzyme
VQRVPVCALVSLQGVDRPGTPAASGDVLTDVRHWIAEGFSVVKFKVGGDGGFMEQLDQLRAVRAEFPHLKIRLDANGSWTPDEALQRLAELKSAIDPELVEQPVGAIDLLTFTDSPVSVAADESLRLSDAILAVTQPGRCDAVVLKPMVLGGHRACALLAREAFANGARVIVTHTFGGKVAHAAACELTLAVAAADPVRDPLAAGLAGHSELMQRDGPWIVPSGETGHGVDKPW